MKSRLRVEEFRLAPAEMQAVADAGVEPLRQRTAAGVGADDAARQKSGRGLAPRRHLRFAGRMLAGLTGRRA